MTLCRACGHPVQDHTGRGIADLPCDHMDADGPCFCDGYQPPRSARPYDFALEVLSLIVIIVFCLWAWWWKAHHG